MITVTWQTLIAYFIAACGGFTAVCVAVGWLIKIIKAVKKPINSVEKRFETVDGKLDSDNKRIKELEAQMSYISSSIGVLMRCDLVILGHLRTDNNTGKMVEMEAEIQDFLIKR